MMNTHHVFELADLCMKMIIYSNYSNLHVKIADHQKNIKSNSPVLPMNMVDPLGDGQTLSDASIVSVCNLLPESGSKAYQTSFLNPEWR